LLLPILKFRIAFSIGFLLGPIIGALFSIWARHNRDTNDHWYAYPAAVALALSLIDLVSRVLCPLLNS
jgi:hypothetical protein